MSTEGEVAREKNRQHLEDLRDYYVRRFAYDLLKGSHEIITEYMKSYSEYSQVLVYMDCDASLGGSCSSSSAFNDTRMFYGDAFEHLTVHFVLPACLNNLVQGRSYDVFKELTLQEYLEKLDKPAKAGPFLNNASLSKIAEGLNNKIRNASHHRRMEFDAKTGTVIYRPSRETITSSSPTEII